MEGSEGNHIGPFNRERRDYQAQFLRFSRKMERTILAGILALLALLLVFQSLLRVEGLGTLLSKALRMEGIPVELVLPSSGGENPSPNRGNFSILSPAK